MTERKTYHVVATPEGEKFWVVRILDLPEGMFSYTQALRANGKGDIWDMAKDFIALSLEVDENSFDLEVEIKEGESYGQSPHS